MHGPKLDPADEPVPDPGAIARTFVLSPTDLENLAYLRDEVARMTGHVATLDRALSSILAAAAWDAADEVTYRPTEDK